MLDIAFFVMEKAALIERSIKIRIETFNFYLLKCFEICFNRKIH